MKLLKKQISAKDGSGMILLRPETAEDLWHTYNLLQTGDLVRCTTIRKVVKESATGSTSSSKKRMMLTVQIQRVDFDPDALELRLSGIVTSESDHVRTGAHHTLTLELNQNYSLEKICWDQIYLDLVDEATHPERQAEIAAVVMEHGLAHVCLVTGVLTITKARIDMNIPKKRTGSTAHTKGIDKFYDNVYQAILRQIDFSKIKCILIGSPGFVKDDFFKYMLQESVKRNDRPLIENKSKFVLCKASSGHKHAIEEVFADPSILSRLTETKVAKEVQILHQFLRTLEHEPSKAWYGYQHVCIAQDNLAIASLLVTDELFRNSNIATRKQYVQLVESVRQSGGQVYIFSSMHVTGQQLQQLSGVAALLRYPLADLDELEQQAATHEEVVVGEEVDEWQALDDFDPERRIREDLEDMGL
jgi:protein pelota